jgi:hypothetical protein
LNELAGIEFNTGRACILSCQHFLPITGARRHRVEAIDGGANPVSRAYRASFSTANWPNSRKFE